jgi:predicted O-methyltransferase YrrM
VRAYYRLCFDVARMLRPRIIVEIGVRAGYSALMLLAGAPAATFYGIDSGDPTYGDPTAFADHAKRLLCEMAARTSITLECKDSRTIPELRVFGERPDLVHVDGDHSFAGAASDIALALRSCAVWTLVDDVDYVPAVAEAALPAARGRMSWRIREPLRGALLIGPKLPDGWNVYPPLPEAW